MSKVHISPEAQVDMDEIKRYIEYDLQNPDAATGTLARITRVMRSLIENPDRGASLSSRMSEKTNYRYLIAGNYLVFYFREGDDVYITRVMYNRRDYIRALLKDSVDVN